MLHFQGKPKSFVYCGVISFHLNQKSFQRVFLPYSQYAAPLLTHPGVGFSMSTFCSLVICCNYQVHFSLIDVIKYI